MAAINLDIANRDVVGIFDGYVGAAIVRVVAGSSIYGRCCSTSETFFFVDFVEANWVSASSVGGLEQPSTFLSLLPKCRPAQSIFNKRNLAYFPLCKLCFIIVLNRERTGGFRASCNFFPINWVNRQQQGFFVAVFIRLFEVFVLLIPSYRIRSSSP